MILSKTRFLVIVFFCVVFLSLVSDSSALASCAVNSFTGSCGNCAFDNYGKMDQTCYNKYENGGRGCLAVKYPVMAVMYPLGSCPALETCVNSLKGCSDVKCVGTGKSNCRNPVCKACYEEADRCAFRASKDCDETARCNDRKCDADKGETQDTCCTDCGCPTGMWCNDNKCVVNSSSGGACTKTDLYYGCNNPPYSTAAGCIAVGIANYQREGYENLKGCCENGNGIWNCYLTGNLRQGLVDAITNELANFAVNNCLGGALLIPIAMLTAMIMKLPVILR